MATVTLQELLNAGTHFGHLTRRWNPKMKKYISMERNGIYIVDLKKTLELNPKFTPARIALDELGIEVN